jgi:transposase
MESCRSNSRQGSRRRVGTAQRRRPLRCGWCAPCARSVGTDHRTVYRVARQLGYGVESVRSCVRQADIDDGYAPGVSTVEPARVRDLDQEIRELKGAKEILKRAASFFGAELERQHKK